MVVSFVDTNVDGKLNASLLGYSTLDVLLFVTNITRKTIKLLFISLLSLFYLGSFEIASSNSNKDNNDNDEVYENKRFK